MARTLLINEIFHSIQGESTFAGLPCVFVRLRGCHLRCTWCDTTYAFTEGEAMEITAIRDQVLSFGTPLVEITGGEPLLQNGVHALIAELLDASCTVLIETSGACDISPCDPRIIRIVDFKPPGSGECDRNDLGNLNHLLPHDEVKFVIGDRQDYEWSLSFLREHDLADRVKAILFSPVYHTPADAHITGHAGLDPGLLASWMLEDRVPARLQLQMHKSIWHPSTRGV